jgi:hypothetical protein
MLLLAFTLLLGFTIFRISRQRCGESSLLWQGQKALNSTETSPAAAMRNFSVRALRNKLTDIFIYPCPINSAPRAEMWLEMKRYGIPIFIIGLGIAVAVPALTFLSVALNWPLIALSVSIAPLFLFFGALGISIFNRRMGNGGYMNNFEGTRAMSTVQLASIQLLVLAGTTLLSIILICTSIWISQTLFSSAGLQIEELMPRWTGSTLSMRAAGLFMMLILYLTAITLFASLHAGSVLWRKKFLIGILLVILYAIYFTVAVKTASDRIAVSAMRANFNTIGDISILDRLDDHMWGFAICVLLLMLVVVGRTLYLKLFTLRSGSIMMLLWLGFLFCSYNILEERGIHLAGMAPELLVFNCALLALPLTLFLLTVWSYDKLRHG